MQPATLYYVGFFTVLIGAGLMVAGFATTSWGSGTYVFDFHLGLFKACISNAGPLSGCMDIDRDCQATKNDVQLPAFSDCDTFNAIRAFAALAVLTLVVFLVLALVSCKAKISPVLTVSFGICAAVFGFIATTVWAVYRSDNLNSLDNAFSFILWTTGWPLALIGSALHFHGGTRWEYRYF